MTFFSSNEMYEFKALKIIYANKVHKFVLEWLDHTQNMTDKQRRDAWCKISRTKLGNLFRSDVSKPKKYKNKYICFCEIMRPRLRSEFPNKPIKEITKILGVRWKDFSAKQDPDLYHQVMAIWEKDQARYSAEKSLSDSLSKEKKSKNLNYQRFCQQLMIESPDTSMAENNKINKLRSNI